MLYSLHYCHSLMFRKNDAKAPCRAIIDHRGAFYHFEVLESILADFPLDDLPEHCDNKLTMDMYFNYWLPNGVAGKIPDYMDYANTYIRPRIYQGYKGQERRLGSLERRLWYTLSDPNLVANIYTTAYCRWPFLTEIDHPKTFAVFHEACPAVESKRGAVWVSPMQPRHFFPSRLPIVEDTALANKQQHHRGPYQLCSIGAIDRRNYGFLEYYFQHYSHSTKPNIRDRLELFILGHGNIPDTISSYTTIHQYDSESFVQYEHKVAHTCHVILTLIDTETKPHYFNSSQSSLKKLTGSLPQSSAYKIPIVLHEQLAESYAPHLVDNLVETHTNDPATFATALDAMLDTLDKKFSQD